MMQHSVYRCLKLEALQSPNTPREILCAVMESANAERARGQGADCGHAVCVPSSHGNLI